MPPKFRSILKDNSSPGMHTEEIFGKRKSDQTLQEFEEESRKNRAIDIQPSLPRQISYEPQGNSSQVQTQQQQGQPESQEEEEAEYVVETILKKRFFDGKLHYYIKWRDYEHPTWEPVDILEGIQELIDEFEKQYKVYEARRPEKTPQIDHTREIIYNEVQKDKAKMQQLVETTQKFIEQRGGFANKNTTPKHHQEDVPKPEKETSKPSIQVGKPKHKPELIDENFEDVEVLDNLILPQFSPVRRETNPLVQPPSHDLKVPKILQDYEEGSFYKGDSIEKILVQKNMSNKEIFFKVIWKPRANSVIPASSYVSYEIVKLYEPYVVLEFWEQWKRKFEEDTP